MSWLSTRMREIREEEWRRNHPVYDFKSRKYLKPGRTNAWLDVPVPDTVSYLGRGA